MTGNAEEVQRSLFLLSQQTASTTEGFVDSQDWDNGFVSVSVGGTTQTLKWVGPAPWPGDRVRITSAGLNPYCELVMGAPNGTVQSVGSGLATVLGDDSKTYKYVNMVGAVASNRVRLDHAGRCVIGVYGVEPEDSEYEPPPPPPKAPSGDGSAWFNPAWSGNWNPGFQGPAVEISSSRMGLYGFGTQIRDTIPNARTITAAELHLTQNWDNVPGVNSSMGTHSFNSPPGSADNGALSGTYSVPGGSRVVNLLGVVADGLKTGSAFGVGFRSGASGWRQYAATPGSGRIFMKWSA